jgi:hypothetical protein
MTTTISGSTGLNLIGTGNQVTFSDSSIQSTSPKTGFVNRIINGDMTIDQRNAGASVSVANGTTAYGVDRFLVYEDTSASSCTVQQVTDAPTGFNYSLKFTVGTGGSASAAQLAVLEHRVEGFNFADFLFGTANAQTFTLSFRVKATATGTYCVAFRNASDNRSYVATYTISAANTWEQKTITVAGDTSGTWNTTNGIGISVRFDMGSGSDYQTSTLSAWQAGLFFSNSSQVNIIGTSSASLQITGVQLEKGSTATPFEFRSIGTELALCQRYLYVLPGGSHTSGYNISTTQAYIPVVLPVTPRTAPTGISTTLSGNLFISSSGYALTNLEYVANSTQTVLLRATTAQTMTTNNGNMLELTNKVLFTGCEL